MHLQRLSRLTTVTVAGSALFMLPLSGCDNAEAESRAEANRQIAKSGTHVVQAEYDQVVTTLQGSEGNSDQQAAKSGTSADALMKIARQELSRADQVGLDLTNQVNLVHAVLDQAMGAQTMLSGIDTIDFSPSLAELDRSETKSRTRKTELEGDVNALTAEINQLEADIASEMQQANNLKEQAAQIRESVDSAPLYQRIGLVEQAADLSRQGDSHQVRAARLEAEVDLLRPQLEELMHRIEQSEIELAGYEHSRTVIRNRQSSLAGERAQIQASVDESVQSINTKLGVIEEMYNASFVPQYQQAAQTAEEAVNRGRPGAPASRNRAATSRQLLGQVHWHGAGVVDDYRGLVARLVAHQGMLGRTGDAATLDALNAAFETAKTSASDAYQAAAEEASDEAMAASMIRIANAINGDETIEAPDLTVASNNDNDDNSSPRMETSGDPADVFRAIYAAGEAGQFDQILDLVYADSPAETDAINELRGVLGAFGELNDACVSAYGRPFPEINNDPDVQAAISNMMGGVDASQQGNDLLANMGLGDLANMSDPDFDIEDMIADVEFSYDNSGTTAWVDGLDEVNFVFKNGEWKLSPEIPDEAIEAFIPFIAPIGKAFEATTLNIENEVFGEELDMMLGLMNAVITELSPVIQQMMQDGGGQGLPFPIGGG